MMNLLIVSFRYTILLSLLFIGPLTFGSGNKCQTVLHAPVAQIHHLSIVKEDGTPGPDYEKVFSFYYHDSRQEGLEAGQTLKTYLNSLTAGQRNELQNRIQRISSYQERNLSNNEQVNLTLLRISLEPEKSITQWMQKISSSDPLKDELIKVGTFIKEYDVELSYFAVGELLKKYFYASKTFSYSTNPREHSLRLPPRRGLTLLFKILNDWPVKLINMIKPAPEKKQKSQSKVAYQFYLDSMSTIMKTLGRDYGKYDSKVIFDVIRIIQKELISYSKNHSGRNDHNYQITLDGSFFNGLAKENSSDVDLFYNHPELEKFIERSQLKSRMNDYFKDQGYYRSPLELQDVAEHVAPQLRNRPGIERKLGELGTVSIRVTVDKLEISIYPLPHKGQYGVVPETFEIEL